MNKTAGSAMMLLALALGFTPAITSAATERVRLIVVLHDQENATAAQATEMAGLVGGQVGHVYAHALKGFSITVPAQAAEVIKKNPRVKYVETDSLIQAFAQNSPTGVRRIGAVENPLIAIDGADDRRVDVDVAVIDTGVDFDHPDLNVAGGVNCVGQSTTAASCVAGGDDDHYHGTHVAGTIGAIDNGSGVVGVAPGARIWAVKVMNKDGLGYLSWILAGIDWVAANAATIEVANMSLGGYGYSQAEHDAIQRAVDRGVSFAVAAGNSASDAGSVSPAAFDNVMAVSALADFNGAAGSGATPTCLGDEDDSLAYFSNHGQAVDIAAPGACITSTIPIEWGGHYGAASGTSMASPHVAGALALLASMNKPRSAAEVYALYNTLKGYGSSAWTDDSNDGIREPMLDVGNANVFAPRLIASNAPAPQVNTPPSVRIQDPKSGAMALVGTSLTFTGAAGDAQDGDLGQGITWVSSLNGQIGAGAGFATASLKPGRHVVTALVRDAGGAVASTSIVVTVVAKMQLKAKAIKANKKKYARLNWSGASSSIVDIYRNNVLVKRVRTKATGTVTDGPVNPALRTGAYKVCVAGQARVCSTPVAVRW